MVEQTYKHFAQELSGDEIVIGELWRALETSYSESHRHYHNLMHIEKLLELAQEFEQDFKDFEAVVWAILYHDIVYSVTRNDNEEQSALQAKKALDQLGASASLMVLCEEHILATATHVKSDNQDTNLLTDLDLSILGSSSEDYKSYTASIRLEYGIFPDNVYNPGRARVLDHFLAMKQIFKTEKCRDLWESQARINLESELKELNTLL